MLYSRAENESWTMTYEATGYALKIRLALDHEAAVARVREALAAEGFGILTEIDMRATMKAKLDVEVRPYVILGACNPPIAHAALEQDADIGLLLPCNVVVYADQDPGESVVAAIDPVVQLGVTANPDVAPMAAEVREKLARVLDSLAD